MEIKRNNLETFKILYLVYGILSFIFSIVPLVYAGFGLFFDQIKELDDDFIEFDELPFDPSTLFIVIGLFGFTLLIVFGILNLKVSKNLKELKNYNFNLVMAILNCLTGLLGILLGVFTIIELTKPEVKKLFGKV